MVMRDEEPALCSLKDACRFPSIGHTKLYELHKAGKVETIKIGRRRLVVVESMRRLIDKAKDRA
jgi:hypothetical protein